MPHKNEYSFVPLNHEMISAADSLTQARAFYQRMDSRRSVRHFSGKPVHRETIAHLIRTASTAPSGAHKQPWTFVAVSDSATKRKIRQAAEAEEKQSYETRMPDEWLEALEPLATGWRKPYLEIAPWLVVLFQQTVELLPEGETRKNYYVVESVGIAAGMFLTAVHQAGLVSLTHTPSPMKFLADILKRPSNEKPFLLMPVGYPEEGCKVPDLQRKGLDQVALFIEEPSPPR